MLAATRKILLASLLALPVAGSSVFAGISDGAGTSAFSFLKINVGARPVAMGGAFTGLADDISALYYNPAAIATLEDDQYVIEYHNYFFDMQSGFIGLVKKQGYERGMALFVGYLNLGDFVQTDRLGNVTGEFGGSDVVFGATYAVSYRETYSFGASAKLIYEKVQNFSSTGIALDIAAHYTTNRGRLRMGMMLQNLGVQLSSFADGGEKDGLPTLLRAGIGGRPRELPFILAADLIFPFDNSAELALGLEYYEIESIYLRLGWNSFASNFKSPGSSSGTAGISLGVGMDVRQSWKLSYAFAPGADLGDSHRVTLIGGL